jgi:hypothetical protein
MFEITFFAKNPVTNGNKCVNAIGLVPLKSEGNSRSTLYSIMFTTSATLHFAYTLYYGFHTILIINREYFPKQH